MRRSRGISDLSRTVNKARDPEFFDFLLDEHGNAEDPSQLSDEERHRDRDDQEIALRLTRTKATAFAIFAAVRPLLSSDIIDRLKQDDSVLILVRIRDTAWRGPAFQGVWRALEDAARTRRIVSGEGLAGVPDVSGDRAWDRKSVQDRSEMIADAFAERTTIACLCPSDRLQPHVEAFVDLEIDLTHISSSAFDAALERRYGEGETGWPADIEPASLHPKWIDLAFSRCRAAAHAVAVIRQAQNATMTAIVGPRLEDLFGYGTAKDWGLRLVAALDEYRAGRLAWGDVDGGALLVGHPGTGKTLFASALAQSAGLAFFPTSYSAWQGTGEGHLGTVMKEMRRIFSEAAASAPALIFIDEVDTLQARGTTSRYDDWWRSITNGLLECLDGTGRREGVVVLAACNDAANLDPALTRSGRLDRTFHVTLPGEEDLAEIFRHHLPSLSEADVQPVATFLAGIASGADAARIARDARSVARTAGREIAAGDLLAVAIPPDTRPQDLRRRIAVHEAGHAVMLLSQGIVPACLSIVDASGGKVAYERSDGEGLPENLYQRLLVHLAGRAAEDIVFGSVSLGAGGPDASDLGKATRLLATIEGRLGLGSRLSVTETVDEALIEARLRTAYADAVMRLLEHRKAILDLAAIALRDRIVGKAALRDFWESR